MKKKLVIVAIVILSTALSSCENRERFKQIADPKEFAQKYCDCMEKNGASKDFLYALAVCQGEFVQRNRLYRIYKTDLQYFDTQKKISKMTNDKRQCIQIYQSCR
jgi:hypothetical protein